MARLCATIFIFYNFFAINIQFSTQCPQESKSIHKNDEIPDQDSPITLDTIKAKLRESGVFDWKDPTLTDRERKEMNKLFNALEIMTMSRMRQPSSVQSTFSTMRIVERTVKKQLKEGQISESLAAKFHWDKILSRNKREYHLDKATNMRIFNFTV